MPDRYFGELLGFPQGSTWPTRAELSRDGVHPPTMGGISGTKADGADSIVVSGGYEDDEDLGDEIVYTGAGGNDAATGKQIADQSIDQPGNAGLVTSQIEGLPVRVIRGSKGDPAWSPSSGFRYDGLYRVADHWSERGKSGFIIWRFRLVRLEPQEAAPYLPTAQAARTAGIATRIVRSTQAGRTVRSLYDDYCQICDFRVEVPGGTLADVVYLQALSRPHNGPDEPANALCVCPNHQALLGNGGIYIGDDWRVRDKDGHAIGPLNRVGQHKLDLVFVRRHRQRWGYE